MSSRHLRIARIAGIPISLDYSWFLIFVLLSWSLSVSYFPEQLPGLNSVIYIGIGVFATFLLFLSVLLHEFGHAIAARHYQIPVHEITLFIFGGMARIQEEPKNASSEFIIAISGPLVSLLLGLVSAAFVPVIPSAIVTAIFRYISYVNFSLFLFNIIPGFPLDGGRVLRAFIWGVTHDTHQATIVAANVGRFIAYSFIVLGLAMVMAGRTLNGLWIAFIGWFLESAAIAQIQQQTLQDILSCYHVGQAASALPVSIPASLPLDVLTERYFLRDGKFAYLVQKDGRPIGIITPYQIKQIPKSQWPVTTAEQVAIPLDKVYAVQRQDDLWSALQNMDREGVNLVLVFDGDRISGILSREDVVSFMQHTHKFGG